MVKWEEGGLGGPTEGTAGVLSLIHYFSASFSWARIFPRPADLYTSTRKKMTSGCAWENRTQRHVKSSVKICKTNELEALRKHMGLIYGDQQCGYLFITDLKIEQSHCWNTMILFSLERKRRLRHLGKHTVSQGALKDV